MSPIKVINEHMKMADVIHLDYMLLPIINRFGIQLGFGNKTVAEICKKKKVNPDFFTEILNAFHDPEYFPKDHLQTFKIDLILDYLIKTHEYYMSFEVPKIEKLINDLINACKIKKESLLLLKDFFRDYKDELTTHINREDDVIYPYIRQLEKFILVGEASDDLKKRIKKYSIEEFANEHDNVEEKLFDLKNIIIKYLPPPKDSNLCNLILSSLFELEKDLNDHARIEDKILIPKVIRLEKKAIDLLKK